MENKERLYIISFGDSAKYRMLYAGTKEQLENSPKIVGLRDELARFIKDNVTEEGSHACRFATPVIKEVDPSDYARYEDYHDFGRVAVDDIKKVLFTEVKNMLDQKQLDSNAPYGEVAPEMLQ